MFDTVKSIVLGRIAEQIVFLGIFLVVGLVVLALVGGTDLLTAIGLSRSTAGTIVTLVVVTGCVAGLAASRSTASTGSDRSRQSRTVVKQWGRPFPF